MAIKYYHNMNKNQTIAVLNDTAFDCMNKIAKMANNVPLCICSDKYRMPNKFRVVVTCIGDDKFDEEEGKRLAKLKLMEKYYKSFDSHYSMFLEDLACITDAIIKDAEENK